MGAEQIYIVHAGSKEQRNFLRSVFKLHKIKFEVAEESTYDKGFTEMVLQAEENIQAGKGTKISSEEFDTLWK